MSSADTPASGAIAEASEIARDAYIYGFPMVDSYRIQHAYFVDQHNPEYKGGWNQLSNIARVYTPADTTVQTPNSDTPYSLLGTDLRAEPLVLTAPPIEAGRYYSLQFITAHARGAEVVTGVLQHPGLRAASRAHPSRRDAAAGTLRHDRHRL